MSLVTVKPCASKLVLSVREQAMIRNFRLLNHEARSIIDASIERLTERKSLCQCKTPSLQLIDGGKA